MWTGFSLRYIRENKVSSILLAGAAFFSSLLLSLLCSIAYNLWIDDVNQQKLVEKAEEIQMGTLAIAEGAALILVCAALIAMIHNAFEVSMGTRLHQLGILKSVGATPRQIRTFLLQEAMAVCGIPVLAGMAAGVGVCYIFVQKAIQLGRMLGLQLEYTPSFAYHGLTAAVSLGAALFTVLLSAWLPARKIGKMTPLEAIFYGNEPMPEKMRGGRMVSKIFGVYGELAQKSLYARRKSMKMAKFSLTLSFLGFFVFLSVETISAMSTQNTYFERFRHVWDYMLVTEKETKLEQKIREIPGVSQCVSYQKIDTEVFVPENLLTKRLRQTGVSVLIENAEEKAADGQKGWKMKAQLFVLDEKSFKQYCEEQKIKSKKETVAVNLLWDSENSDWKNRKYIPLLRKDSGIIKVGGTKEISQKITFSYDALAKAIPAVREEMEQKALTLVLSEKTFLPEADNFLDTNTYYNIRIGDKTAEEKIEKELTALMAPEGDYKLESRTEKERTDQAARKGLRIVVGILAVMLACVGLAGMLSATLGQIYQRKKEYARYLSVGVSPRKMRKLMFLEGFYLLAGPFLLAAAIDIPVTALFLHMAPVTPAEFLRGFPVTPLIFFLFLMAGVVAVAYWTACRRIGRGNLIEVLKDETMV